MVTNQLKEPACDGNSINSFALGMSCVSVGLAIVMHVMWLQFNILCVSSNSFVNRSCVRKMSPFERLIQAMPRNVNDVFSERTRSGQNSHNEVRACINASRIGPSGAMARKSST